MHMDVSADRVDIDEPWKRSPNCGLDLATILAKLRWNVFHTQDSVELLFAIHMNHLSRVIAADPILTYLKAVPAGNSPELHMVRL